MDEGQRRGMIDEQLALQRQNAALLEDNEDLRASALWWKSLYEEAQRRHARPRELSEGARHFSRGSAFPDVIPEPSTRAAPRRSDASSVTPPSRAPLNDPFLS